MLKWTIYSFQLLASYFTALSADFTEISSRLVTFNVPGNPCLSLNPMLSTLLPKRPFLIVIPVLARRLASFSLEYLGKM